MTEFERNLKFLSYGSTPVHIPKELGFLNRYFKTKVQRAFLKYYYVFRDKKFFIEHTGIVATSSFLIKLAGKFEYLLQEYENAKKDLNLEKLAAMQSGKFKVLKKFY